MFDIKQAKRHAALFDEAAQKIGVDLQEAAIAGDLPFDCIADGVHRCMGCSGPSACRDWLDNAQDDNATLPRFCRNKWLLKRLQDGAQ